jgi:hypothetical protein
MSPATDVTQVTRQARGWKGTWLHDVNGGNALTKSKPFQPGRSGMVSIRIPGCE